MLGLCSNVNSVSVSELQGKEGRSRPAPQPSGPQGWLLGWKLAGEGFNVVPKVTKTKIPEGSEGSTPTLKIVYRFSDSVLLLSNLGFTESLKSHVPSMTIKVFKAT